MVALLVFVIATLEIGFGQKKTVGRNRLALSGDSVIKNHVLINDSAFSAFFRKLLPAVKKATS